MILETMLSDLEHAMSAHEHCTVRLNVLGDAGTALYKVPDEDRRVHHVRRHLERQGVDANGLKTATRH